MRLLAALRGEVLDRPPVWMMRQAGRYLPEYRRLRERHGFDEAMRTPSIAAEISLQPIRRFGLDAAIVFSDIMTPLIGMGVDVVFDPGPKLSPMSLEEVSMLGPLAPGAVGYVAETISLVKSELSPDVATIGFAGGPMTVLAYLVEGGGSQHFPRFRAAVHASDPGRALAVLAAGMRAHLLTQVEAGVEVVQLFDTWAGLLSPEQFRRWAVPAAQAALSDVPVPTIYFVPGGSHLLEVLHLVGADAYGVDWRLPIDQAWSRLGTDKVIQGNLDPAALLGTPDSARSATEDVLELANGRPGHVFNLGHGVLPETPVENVMAMVETILAHRGPSRSTRVREAAAT